MVRKADFLPSVELPAGLDVAAIRRAVDYVERELADLVEIYFEQANVFSGMVGTFGAKALHTFSPYEKHKNVDTAQQRFPDLKRRGSGRSPRPSECLESKGSKRPWAIQSHYDHPGWYIIWRYLVDPTESLERGRPVIIWRVDVVFLNRSDWKYEQRRRERRRTDSYVRCPEPRPQAQSEGCIPAQGRRGARRQARPRQRRLAAQEFRSVGQDLEHLVVLARGRVNFDADALARARARDGLVLNLHGLDRLREVGRLPDQVHRVADFERAAGNLEDRDSQAIEVVRDLPDLDLRHGKPPTKMPTRPTQR
jgi:hypothetical protein